MALNEGQPRGIYILLTEESREDPYVRAIVGLLEASDIATPEDLIASPTKYLEQILSSRPSMDHPFTPLTLGISLKTVAEFNAH